MDSGQRLLRGLRAQEAQREAQKELKKLGGFQKLLLHLGRKHYLGEETRENWTGYSPFYLFWCPECENYYVDSRHGHRPYVTCHRCMIHYSLEPWWTPLTELRNSLRLVIKARFGRF